MYLKILFFDKVSSTNDIAHERSEIDKEFTIYLANTQTKGRGRNNRVWFSPEGKNLYFSFLIKPQTQITFNYLPILPVLTGYSVFKTIKKYIKNKKIFLKWPNDIIVENKKISGILIEARKNYIVIGIGINVNTESFPKLEGNIPTSIYIETDKFHDRLNLLYDFIKIFKKNYEIFLKNKKISDKILNEINENLYLKNKMVNVIFNDKIEQGKLIKINNDGSILVSGKKIYAGDIIKLSEKNNT